MGKIILFFNIILISILILTCNDGNFNLLQARKAILEQNTKRICALKVGDIDTLLELYTDDAILLPPHDTMKHGKREIYMFYLLNPPLGKIIDASIESTEIKGLESPIYEIGEYYLTIKLFDSDATKIDKKKYLAIWEHQTDGSWKIYTECWNSDFNQSYELHNWTSQ
ncbi:MAG: nuclear transport factor 2 family protein [Bacteroidota bacterium]|nr:nuclear transport factor 2 family protein [Bacteroidota bacterium]